MADLGTAVIKEYTDVLDTQGLVTLESIDLDYTLDVPVEVFNLHNKPIPRPPILGQLWPRGMVGPYTGVAVGGQARLFWLTQDVVPPHSRIGQLWPRGDFIPSEQVVIVNTDYGYGPYGYSPYGH